MSEQPAVPSESTRKYRLVQSGGGFEELDRLTLRERIRSGAVNASTELAVVGTDDWQIASAYPELARYLEIAEKSSWASSAQGAVRPPREVQSMGERIVSGLRYPIAGGEIVTLAGLAILSVIPLIGFFASLASTVIMLTIIRKSADGSATMPPLIDTSNVPQMVWLYVRVIFVTIVALAPFLVFAAYGFASFFKDGLSGASVIIGTVIGLAFAMLYYPACLATIAVWDDTLSALNPLNIARVIRTIGSDYFIVIGMWFVATAVTTLLTMPGISPLSSIPYVGGIIGKMLSLWGLFYASHLLGYAVYRHAPELGWE